MSGAVADTSVWIDFFAGRFAAALEEALSQGTVVLPPLVVAELISGARRNSERLAIGELLGSILRSRGSLSSRISRRGEAAA